MTRLFIAEKPSLGKAIASRLGKPHKSGNGFIETKDAIVVWCFGHMFEQPGTDYYVLGRKPKPKEVVKWERHLLPIVPNKWVIFPKADCAKQLKVIQGFIKNATSIVNAGDPDREGQLLVDELIEYYGYRGKVDRIWLNAIDDVSVDRALKAIKSNKDYAALKDEALGRSRADWLLGMNLTQAYTLSNKAGSLISIGRVQTPTLALIAKRDNEIDNFRPVNYFVPFIDVEHENGEFRAIYKPSKNVKVDSAGRIIDIQVAKDLIAKVQHGHGKIAAKTVEDKKVAPPLPFSLSSIQKEASAKFGYGAEQVLNLVQHLYEKRKAVSYPRTDCEFLPESQYADSGTILSNMKSLFPNMVAGANPKLKSRAFNDKETTAHHGIIPTMVKPNMSIFSPQERNIYELICMNYVAQFYPWYEFKQTTIAVDVKDEIFVARGKVEKVKGWHEIIPVKSQKGDGEGDLPLVTKGDEVEVENASALNKQTKPPARFTQGTLIDAMKNIHRFVDDQRSADILKKSKGIGAESTRAGIIKTLFQRGFIEKKGKSIVTTDSGKLLVSQLQDELKYPVTTAAWEMRLELVGSGKMSLDKFVDDIINHAVKPLCNDMVQKKLDIPLNQKGSGTSAKKKFYKKKGATTK